MRAKEFITEKKNGKLTPRQVQSTKGLHTYSDGEKADSTYTSYRLGLAVACSDGKTPLDIDAKTWYGKKKTAHPYTELEADMLKQSYEAVGADYTDLNHGNLDSEELKTTNSVSPVAKVKRNKYGI
jgi:hypothetical protein